MASWLDGAEYAPVERPDGFATPKAAPLEQAAAPAPTTPGAVPRPIRLVAQPARPLEELVVQQRSRRDPKESFQVSSMLLTAQPDGTAGRDPKQPFTTSTSVDVLAAPSRPPLPPPTLPPLPPPAVLPLPPRPSLPYPPPTAPPVASPVASPSTANSSQASYQRQSPPPPTAAATAQTQRTLILLAGGAALLGAVFPPGVGILMLVAAGLTFRTRARTKSLWIVAALVGVIASLFPGQPQQVTGVWIIIAVGFAVGCLCFALIRRD